MCHHRTHPTGRGWLALLALLGAAAAAPADPPAKPTEGAGLPSGIIKEEAWRGAATEPIKPEEIDRLINAHLQSAGIKPAPRTTDEQFIRRVYLDLTGKLPQTAEVRTFAADTAPDKRAKLIDKLLDSDDYSRHWARYWRDVMSARLTDFRARVLARSFETWLTDQIKSNRGWDEVVRDLLTAEGEVRFDDRTGKTGNLYFLASHNGADAAAEMAAETSRVFLGIQINCAQCHDHPFDQWKREQFHELAAYFARVRQRLVRDPESRRFVGVALVSRPRGEYRMPGKESTSRFGGTITYPKFIDGTSPRGTSPRGRPFGPRGRSLSDRDRRRSLADSVVSKDNYWFSGAFVNRVWGELMGQSFYQPVDDMGPEKEAVFGNVLARLAGSFRGTDHDTKALLRAVMNSETYQRQVRLGESANDHLRFAAAYPTRLRADALWDSLETVLGPLGGRFGRGGPRGPGGFRRGFGGGLERQFKAEFRFDPSLKSEDVEGSIPQALILMNNPLINERITARGNTALAGILEENRKDDDALEAIYLRALSRKPTAREKEKCLAYVKKVGSRAEAFEDILWALINSTEFQTKR